MKIIIRADAAQQIGTGHVMRCMTLAGRLKRYGADVSFICRKHSGDLRKKIRKAGYYVHELQCTNVDSLGQDDNDDYSNWLGGSWEDDASQCVQCIQESGSVIDWLITDHYSLDIRWEEMLKPHVKNLFVIDDLANRNHNCHILLDQNFYYGMEKRYKRLVPDKCRQLLGPNYCILRQEFTEKRKHVKPRSGGIKKIVIFFGGVDLNNDTCKALDGISSLSIPDLCVDVIVGERNHNKEDIYEMSASMIGVSCYDYTENIAEYFLNADLAIGAAGTTAWERCCMGLPAIVISIARNQERVSEDLSEYGAIYYLGKSQNVSEDDISNALLGLMETPHKIKRMSERSIALVDGAGTDRIIDLIVR